MKIAHKKLAIATSFALAAFAVGVPAVATAEETAIVQTARIDTGSIDSVTAPGGSSVFNLGNQFAEGSSNILGPIGTYFANFTLSSGSFIQGIINAILIPIKHLAGMIG